MFSQATRGALALGRVGLRRSATATRQAAEAPPPAFARLPGGGARVSPAAALQTKPHSIRSCTAVNGGKQIVLDFADNTRYQVHATWLKDSSPARTGADFYRTSAADVWKLRDFTVAGAEPEAEGERLVVKFQNKSGDAAKGSDDTFESKWLHSLMPFVGKALHAGGSIEPEALAAGTSSLLDCLHHKRRGWRSDVEMPKFDAKQLCADHDLQVEFLERMVDPGVAMITGVDAPESLEREFAGKPLENVVMQIIGKLNQHPVRSTRYGVMRKTAESAKQGADYDMQNPLSMHTDHSVYHGTPGYIQFLYQAQGSVRSKVCDGLALAEYVKAHHPEAYELLTTVEITHSSRNNLYTPEGAPRNIKDPNSQGMPFELVHTHPVIVLDANGQVEKVVQSETKRGVCALPYAIYEPFMEAYELWVQLCEDSRFIKNFDWPEGAIVCTNNWRTLHGRASVPPEMARTMCFGYVNKTLVENRYRYLKQEQAERRNPNMGVKWLTRVPNQALERMLA